MNTCSLQHMFIQNCRLLTVLQIHVSFTWGRFFFLNDVYSICPSFGSQFSQSVHVFWNLFINKRCTVLGLHLCLDKQIVSLLCNNIEFQGDIFVVGHFTEELCSSHNMNLQHKQIALTNDCAYLSVLFPAPPSKNFL